MKDISPADIDSPAVQALPRTAPFMIEGVSYGQFSVARHFGGLRLMGHYFLYQPASDARARGCCESCDGGAGGNEGRQAVKFLSLYSGIGVHDEGNSLLETLNEQQIHLLGCGGDGNAMGGGSDMSEQETHSGQIQSKNEFFIGMLIDKPPRALVVGYDPEEGDVYACPYPRCGHQASAEGCDIIGAEPGCLFCNRCNREFQAWDEEEESE